MWGKQGEGVRGWRREGDAEGRGVGVGGTGLNTAVSGVRPSWSFLFFLAWDFVPCPAAQMQPERCRVLSSTGSAGRDAGGGESCAPVAQLGGKKIAPRSASPHLVGLEEAHEDGEEDRGRSRLGTLPEVVDHIVEGFLEGGSGTAPECKPWM